MVDGLTDTREASCRRVLRRQQGLLAKIYSELAGGIHMHIIARHAFCKQVAVLMMAGGLESGICMVPVLV